MTPFQTAAPETAETTETAQDAGMTRRLVDICAQLEAEERKIQDDIAELCNRLARRRSDIWSLRQAYKVLTREDMGEHLESTPATGPETGLTTPTADSLIDNLTKPPVTEPQGLKRSQAPWAPRAETERREQLLAAQLRLWPIGGRVVSDLYNICERVDATHWMIGHPDNPRIAALETLVKTQCEADTKAPPLDAVSLTQTLENRIRAWVRCENGLYAKCDTDNEAWVLLGRQARKITAEHLARRKPIACLPVGTSQVAASWSTS